MPEFGQPAVNQRTTNRDGVRLRVTVDQKSREDLGWKAKILSGYW
jgi:hypothetical protein